MVWQKCSGIRRSYLGCHPHQRKKRNALRPVGEKKSVGLVIIFLQINVTGKMLTAEKAKTRCKRATLCIGCACDPPAVRMDRISPEHDIVAVTPLLKSRLHASTRFYPG